MDHLYYLCFSINKLTDLTLTKYSIFDGSSVKNIMDKHGVFLRQLHRLGYTSGVYFHLLYYYNPDKSMPTTLSMRSGIHTRHAVLRAESTQKS